MFTSLASPDAWHVGVNAKTNKCAIDFRIADTLVMTINGTNVSSIIGLTGSISLHPR